MIVAAIPEYGTTFARLNCANGRRGGSAGTVCDGRVGGKNRSVEPPLRVDAVQRHP